jgi:hypothetical protein
MALHPDAIAQKCSSRKSAARVDRDHPHSLPHLPKMLDEMIEEA